jgi:endonuclease YncB( thermonuclease family)
MIKNILLVSLLTVAAFVPVRAGVVLQAVVVEVKNGNTLVAMNQGRKITVILEAVDAPQKGHPFDAIATKHLSDFVLGKLVAVEYSAIGSQSTLIGKVLVNNVDIGQQMIRDGAARFDRRRERNLRVQDRIAYIESETAAHSEKRGVWQDGVVWPEPQAAHATPDANANSNSGPDSRDPFRSVSVDELAKETKPKPAQPPAELRWPMFSPAGADFSLRIPPGGRDFPFDIPLPSGETVKASMYVVQHPNIEYTTIWAVGPNHKQNLPAMFESTLDALSDALKARGYPCDFSKGKDVVMNGYKVLQYSFQGCIYKGGVRVFHKVDGNDLRVYTIAVVSTDDKPVVIDQFLTSFTFNQ